MHVCFCCVCFSFSVLSQEIGWRRLWNYVFCVGWDAKPQLNQSQWEGGVKGMECKESPRAVHNVHLCFDGCFPGQMRTSDCSRLVFFLPELLEEQFLRSEAQVFYRLGVFQRAVSKHWGKLMHDLSWSHLTASKYLSGSLGMWELIHMVCVCMSLSDDGGRTLFRYVTSHPRPTQPFILSESINWAVSHFNGCVPVTPSGECSRG